MTRAPRDEFMAGYLIAVSNIMNLHGEDVIAEDVLLQAGVDRSILDGLDLCEYDLGPLNKLFAEIERKDALAKARGEHSGEPLV